MKLYYNVKTTIFRNYLHSWNYFFGEKQRSSLKTHKKFIFHAPKFWWMFVYLNFVKILSNICVPRVIPTKVIQLPQMKTGVELLPFVGENTKNKSASNQSISNEKLHYARSKKHKKSDLKQKIKTRSDEKSSEFERLKCDETIQACRLVAASSSFSSNDFVQTLGRLKRERKRNKIEKLKCGHVIFWYTRALWKVTNFWENLNVNWPFLNTWYIS